MKTRCVPAICPRSYERRTGVVCVLWVLATSLAGESRPEVGEAQSGRVDRGHDTLVSGMTDLQPTSSSGATVVRRGDQAIRPKISLIVCTRNRSARLPQFFAHLALLDFPEGAWELVVVDHASSDRTPQAIEEFAAASPISSCHVRASADSLTGAKNIGLSYARGDILAFTDDDCYVRSDYLQALADVFAGHDVGVVGGRVVLHDPTDARLSIRDVDTPADIAPHTFVRAGTIHGANMAVRREVVYAVGGFDPLFGPGTRCMAAEDVEYVARAVWAGWCARYDPRPVVAHHHGRKPGDDTERYRSTYDYGRGAYYTKYVLVPRASRIYLREWIALTRRAPRAVRRKRLGCELAGGRRYLVERLVRPRAIPHMLAIPTGSTTTVPSI